MEKDKTLFRATQVIWYVVYLIEGVLLLRFALKLFGANPGAGFTQFVYDITTPLIAPFQFVFNANSAGESVFEWSVILAALVYYLFGMALIKLVAMMRSVDSTEVDDSLRSNDQS